MLDSLLRGSRSAPIYLIGIVLMVAPGFAGAIAPLTTAKLIEHCDAYAETPESPDALICIHYIKGFVAGAIATDEQVYENVVKGLSTEMGFADRYAEIRFGREMVDYGPTYFAEFCVPDEVPLAEVVEKVVFDLRDAELVRENPLARDAVYRALRIDYACQ